MKTPEHRPDLPELEARLGHVFHEPAQLEAALTHRSYSTEHQLPMPMENQRLEFLGDAVLGAVAAEWLVAHHADWREGRLTKVRSRLTNEAGLARVARQWKLGAFLRLGRGEEQGGGREKDAILADTLEAVIGAIWLDGGVEPVRKIFAEGFAVAIAEAVAAGGDDNPKGELQEWLQQAGRESPRYETEEESGPPHQRHFRVAVFCGAKPLGQGEGASKREAEVNAARQALDRLVIQDGKDGV